MADLRVDQLAGIELLLDTIRTGSISAAARAHSLSQPSATERLRQLERRLGVTLLRRGPGGTAPTPEGEAVAEWARNVLSAVDAMAAGVAAIRERSSSTALRVMASLTVAEYVLPSWLHAQRRGGGRSIDLAVGNSVAVARAVLDRHSDVGFVETPRRFVGLRSTVVGGDRLVVVVAPTHPWARRRSSLTIDQLAATPLLLREPGSGTREAFEAALAAAGAVPVEPLAALASTTTLKAAAAAGDGPSVLSELAVANEVAAGSLLVVPVDGLDLRREFRALWLPDRHDPDVQRFIRLARSAAR
jgi:molybdate transport repressor ModE-like protein